MSFRDGDAATAESSKDLAGVKQGDDINWDLSPKLGGPTPLVLLWQDTSIPFSRRTLRDLSFEKAKKLLSDTLIWSDVKDHVAHRGKFVDEAVFEAVFSPETEKQAIVLDSSSWVEMVSSAEVTGIMIKYNLPSQ